MAGVGNIEKKQNPPEDISALQLSIVRKRNEILDALRRKFGLESNQYQGAVKKYQDIERKLKQLREEIGGTARDILAEIKQEMEQFSQMDPRWFYERAEGNLKSIVGNSFWNEGIKRDKNWFIKTLLYLRPKDGGKYNSEITQLLEKAKKLGDAEIPDDEMMLKISNLIQVNSTRLISIGHMSSQEELTARIIGKDVTELTFGKGKIVGRESRIGYFVSSQKEVEALFSKNNAISTINPELFANYLLLLESQGNLTPEYLYIHLGKENFNTLLQLWKDKTTTRAKEALKMHNKDHIISDIITFSSESLKQVTINLYKERTYSDNDIDFYLKNYKERVKLIDDKAFLLKIFQKIKEKNQTLNFSAIGENFKEDIDIITNFPGTLYEDDLAGFSTTSLIGEKSHELKKEFIQILINKCQHGTEWVILEKIFLAKSSSQGLLWLKEIISFITQRNLLQYVPLYIIRDDTKKVLGTQAQERLETRPLSSLKKEVEYLLSGSISLDGHSKTIELENNGLHGGRDRKQSLIKSINKHIEQFGINSPEDKDAVRAIIKSEMVLNFPSLYSFIWRDPELRNFALSEDIAIISIIPLDKRKGRDVLSAFTEGCKKILNNNSKKTSSYIKEYFKFLEFEDINEYVGIYKALGKRVPDIFLAESSLIKVSKLLEKGDPIIGTQEDLAFITNLGETVTKFLSQESEIVKLQNLYKDLSPEEVVKFQDEKRRIIEAFLGDRKNPEVIARIERATENPDWFEQNINFLISEFGQDSKKFEAFIKKLKEIDIGRTRASIKANVLKNLSDIQPEGRLGEVSVKNVIEGREVYALDPDAIQKKFQIFLKTFKSQAGERREDISSRALEEFLKDFPKEKQSVIKEILLKFERLEKDEAIRDFTPEAISAAREGKFEQFYTQYYEAKYDLPKTVPQTIIFEKRAEVVDSDIQGVNSENGRYIFHSNEIGKVEITEAEAKIIKPGSIAEKNFITFQKTLQTFGLRELWHHRENIFAGIKSKYPMAFTSDSSNFLDENEQRLFFGMILKSVKDGLESEYTSLQGIIPDKLEDKSLQEILRVLISIQSRNIHPKSKRNESIIEEQFRKSYFEKGNYGENFKRTRFITTIY